MSMAEKRNIVIVGGGGAGAPIARMLSEELDITKYNLILVTGRPYYTHLPAWIRMSVTEEGHLEDRAHITYNFNFYNGNGEFVIGKAASIVTEEGDKAGHIILESGQRVDYEVLILTPGSVREGPLDIPDTKQETVQWLKMWRGKFRDAEDIVLVGGGAVALEYAGELKDYYPKKRVTIVHKHEWLLNDAYPKYFRKQVQKGVEKRGVQVILNDQVEDLDIKAGGVIVTKNGRRLVADLVVPCRGPKPNSGFVTLDDASLSPSKHVKVSTTMQVRNYPRIFAAGDVIDRDEQKQVSKYHAHASVVAKNVVDLLAGKQPSALYQGCFEMISITNGKGGSSYWSVFWGPTFGDWVSSTLKSKDLFLTWTRKSMGLKG